MNDVDDLIARGAVQRSRKYCKVFVPPSPSCLDWLRENDPGAYDRLVEDALQRVESEAKAILWGRASGLTEIVLSYSEFAEFREKTTGKTLWTAEGKKHCPDCKSLGHIHRRDCTAVAK